MEYAKDIVLDVHYGQECKVQKRKAKILNKIIEYISNHKMITTIVCITLMLMTLDVMLVSSFVQVLTNI